MKLRKVSLWGIIGHPSRNRCADARIIPEAAGWTELSRCSAQAVEYASAHIHDVQLTTLVLGERADAEVGLEQLGHAPLSRRLFVNGPDQPAAEIAEEVCRAEGRHLAAAIPETARDRAALVVAILGDRQNQ